MKYGMRNQSMSEQLEERRARLVENKANYYLRRYKPQMEALQSSPLSKVRSLTNMDVWALGEQLAHFDDYRMSIQEAGTANDLGSLPKVALDIITASYGSSVIPMLFSVQPIEEVRGTVYFKRTVAQKTRGNVTAGNVIRDPRRAPDVYPQGYAAEGVTVALGSTASGTTEYSGVISGISSTNPIRPYAFRVLCALPYLSISAQDDGKGNVLGVGVQGLIDYNTGAWSLRFLDDPGAVAGITAIYGADFEAGAEYAKINTLNDTASVEAEIFVLGAEVGIFKAYQMKKRFGMVAEDQMIADLTNEMNAELGNTGIARLVSAVTGDLVQWSKSHTGYSWAEHKLEIKDAIAQSEGNILTNAGRGRISAMIAGTSAASILSTLAGFEKIAVNASGPALYGTLDGMTVIRAPQIEPNKIYTIYKGTDGFDAAGVYAPYMPLFVSNTLPAPNNVLQRQGVACVQAGFAICAPAFINGVEIVA